MNENGNRLPIIEALIFSSPEPLPTSKIINILQSITASEIEKIVTELNEKYMMNDASYRIRKIASGYQIYITENYAGYVEELFTRRRVQKLTRAMLETLAIVAYRQPVTRVDIEMIRGVSSDSAVRTLLERKFITLAGRAKTIGRPLLYSTTDEFLKYFGLNSLKDLPKMEEIEELLSAREPESQQMLALESTAENVENNEQSEIDIINESSASDDAIENVSDTVEIGETGQDESVSEITDEIDIVNENSASDDAIDDVSDTVETADTGQNDSGFEETDESKDNIISITEYKKNQFGTSEKIEEKEAVEVTTAAEEF